MAKPLGTNRHGLVVFAKDIARVASFYSKTLELEWVAEEPSHVLLQGAGLELVVHAIPQQIAATIEIATPPRVRGETPMKPTFTVTSLAAVRVAAVAAGGDLKADSEAWSFRGARVLDGWDPEGNVVQFRENEA